MFKIKFSKAQKAMFDNTKHITEKASHGYFSARKNFSSIKFHTFYFSSINFEMDYHLYLSMESGKFNFKINCVNKKIQMANVYEN